MTQVSGEGWGLGRLKEIIDNTRYFVLYELVFDWTVLYLVPTVGTRMKKGCIFSK